MLDTLTTVYEAVWVKELLWVRRRSKNPTKPQLNRLHWSTKIVSHEEKYLFLMYFWTPNSNMFPEFLYHPHFSRCIRLCESTSLHMCVTEGL